MNKNYDALVVITTGEIAKVDVIPKQNYWLLIVRWGEHKAEFRYKGVFAERFARLAEESLRHASLSNQPTGTKSRAARA